MTDQIRQYQTESLDLIRNEFIAGKKKVLLWLATGGGKTFIFSKMIKEAASRGLSAIVVVRGRKLVDQASQRLFRERVHHGVLMAGHWNYRPHIPIQVCSIDTLIARQLRPKADLIIIDEAHMATSEGYKKFLSLYDTFVVSVTATPYCDKGLRHVADTVVHPISMQGLIDAGYLVPFRYFAPSEPDLTEVAVSRSTKDYVSEQLETAMVAGQLTGKIIDHWKKIAEGRPTICFAVNVHHSKLLVDNFLMNGVTAEHCDADTPDGERNAIISRLESGETKVVCNVGILSTGVDIPSLGCIIMARPTKSRNLYVQQAGRGTRIANEKTNCILLDHAGNINRHGLPTDEPDVDLDGKETKKIVRESKTCKNCFAVYLGKECPECGVEAPAPPKVDILETEEELKELTEADLDIVTRTHKQLLRDALQKGRKPAWAHYRLIDRFGFDDARPNLPQWFLQHYGRSQASPFANSPYQNANPGNA